MPMKKELLIKQMILATKLPIGTYSKKLNGHQQKIMNSHLKVSK